jgi:hypothetical protein
MDAIQVATHLPTVLSVSPRSNSSSSESTLQESAARAATSVSDFRR